MGWFSPYAYKSRSGHKYWLHVKERGKVKLYYFSKDMNGALNNLPKGYEVVENKKTGMPMLKKGGGGLLGLIIGRVNTTKKQEKSNKSRA